MRKRYSLLTVYVITVIFCGLEMLARLFPPQNIATIPSHRVEIIHSYLYWFFQVKVLDKYTVGRPIIPSLNPDGLPEEGLSIVDLTKIIPVNSKLVSWKVYSHGKNQLRLKVWRKKENYWYVTAESRLYSVRNGYYTLQIDTDLFASKGDCIGFYSQNGNLSNNTNPEGGKFYTAGDKKVLAQGAYDTTGDYAFRVYYESLPK